MYDNDSVRQKLLDFLSGDISLLEDKQLQSLNMNNVKAALDWLYALKDNKSIDQDILDALLTSGWRFTYKIKPPTPSEFLTRAWIGDQADSMWAPVGKAFCEFMDPNSPYRDLILYTPIGWGKEQPVSTMVDTDSFIEVCLDDGTALKYKPDEKLKVIVNGTEKIIEAKELETMDLSTVDFPQPTN